MTCELCGGVAVIGSLCWSCHQKQFYDAPVTTETPQTLPSNKDAVCIKEGCGGKPHSRGLCGRCYQEWRTKPTNYDPKYGLPERPKCTVPGCAGFLYAKEMCGLHYNRAKAGKPLENPPENLSPAQKHEVLDTINQLVNALGDIGPLVSSEMNGTGLNVQLKFPDGTEAKCKLRIEA